MLLLENEMIEKLREKIKDYYGCAMQIYPATMFELEKIEYMADEEIIKEAEKLHLIRGIDKI